MMPSSQELDYFTTLAEVLNFSRAAERIGISQPSLSASIKKLERAVGVELFFRDKHKVKLTIAGTRFLTHAKAMQQLWQASKASCYAAENEVQGRVILGCHVSLALCLLPSALSALIAAHPQLTLELKHDLSRRITAEVIGLTMDVGLVVNPVLHPDLIIRKLADDAFTCWISKDCVAGNEKVIVCDPNLLQTQAILKQLSQVGMAYDRVLPSNNLELILALVKAGAGVGILPGSVVSTLPRGQLTKLPEAPYFKDEICVIYRHENRHNLAVQAVIQAISPRGDLQPLVGLDQFNQC